MRRSKDLIGKLYHFIRRMDSEDMETRVKALTPKTLDRALRIMTLFTCRILLYLE